MFCGKVEAQISYPEADSISYQLYNGKDWSKLLRFAKETEKQGVKFYLLDIRAGIAAYELGRWSIAEFYFNEAREEYPAGYVAPEYLYWIYHFTGRKVEERNIAKALPDSISLRIGYKEHNYLENIYLEGGLRFSDNVDSAGHNYYYSLSANHKLNSRFSIYQNFTMFHQNLYWSKYEQQQYTIYPSYYLGKSWEVGAAVSLINFNRKLNVHYEGAELLDHRELFTPMGIVVRDSSLITLTDLKGKSIVRTLDLHLNINKRIHEFSFTGQAVLYAESVIPHYDSISTGIYRTVIIPPDGSVNTIDLTTVETHPINQVTTKMQYQLGGSIDYTLRFGKSIWLRPGIEAHAVLLEKSSEILLVPYMEFVMLNRFSLFGYYLQKGAYPASFFNGTHVFNTYDKYEHRISMSLGFALNAKTGISITYQNDKITDSFTGYRYSFNSGYIGLNVKL